MWLAEYEGGDGVWFLSLGYLGIGIFVLIFYIVCFGGRVVELWGYLSSFIERYRGRGDNFLVFVC